MRVLELTWEYAPAMTGGLGVACRGICEALIEDRALRVVIAQPVAGGVRRRRGGSLPALILPDGGYAAPFEAVALYSESVEREFGAEPFDVVHAHDWLAFDAALRLHRQSGVPIVAHVHSLAVDRDVRPNARILALERECLREAAAVIAVSGFTRDRIVASCGVAPERIEVIHNGIDLPDAEPAGDLDPLDARTRRVTFVGRLAPQKAPERFIAMAGLLAARDPQVRFSVVGDGALREILRLAAARVGLQERMTFHGFVGQPEVQALLRDSRVLVLPSRSEPFGLAALEAVAVGTPVVISRQCGLTEAVPSVVAVDAEDPAVLADACAELLDDAPRADALRRAALAQARGRTWARAAREITRVLAASCLSTA